MQNQNEEKFWAIVELFGHTTLAGEVSKSDIGDFVQINIPEIENIPAWTKIVNPKAIYGITPVTEEVAVNKAKTIKSMPIDRWDTEELFRNRFNELIEQGKIKQLESGNEDPFN